MVATGLLLTSAMAGDVGWRSASGNPLPDTQSRKSVDGFGAWLLVTSSSELPQQGDALRSLEFAQSRQVTFVKAGDRISLPVFVLNPTRDARSGEADVICDVAFNRPDGTPEKRYSFKCLTGPSAGSASVRVINAAIEFVGEPGDPPGTWTVDVVVHDRAGGKTLSLRATFDLRIEI
jgi:hypothetical protein